ncbi:MAG: metal ABC transporter substrate-binding protein [Deltaproteobacteria bacterium]|jgi:ABC-type Zn uptake system ZnuABC Zn-binding protein ZnuA|nr:metal ABC transporter substrate-binding protein [Deltaproteobacteria bacterium]
MPEAFFSVLIILLTIFFLSPGLRAESSGPRLMAASYPVWLFTRYLTYGRDFFQVELLTNPETGCPHEYAPQPRDLERLSQSRILVRNGLGLETYLERALKVAPKDIIIIDASKDLPTLAVSWGRLDLGSAAGRTAADEGQSPLEPNAHIFSSPRLAGLMAQNIAAGLAQADPEGAGYYQERLTAFKADMDYLNSFILSFNESRRGYRIITSHGFMDYLAQDLGLVILADIEPAPETPPSAARLEALASLIKSGGLAAVLTDPHGDLDMARTLAAEGQVPAAVIDPVTAGPADPEPDYYQKVIRENLILLARLLPANAQIETAP